MSGCKQTTIGIKLDTPEVSTIEKRAAKMGISKTKFTKLLVKDWLKSGRTLTLSEGE